jgi:thymidine kinase
MNSGKSLDLLRLAHSHEEGGRDVMVVKPLSDTKGGNVITSRIGLSREVDVLVPPDLDLRRTITEAHIKMSKAGKEIYHVLVDEAQFLAPEQVDQLFMLAIDDPCIPVTAFGLRTDFQTHSFPGSARLLEVAHSIHPIDAPCRLCPSDSMFNARMLDGNFVLGGPQVAIDGEADVSYESLCGRCYVREVGEVTARVAEDLLTA